MRSIQVSLFILFITRFVFAQAPALYTEISSEKLYYGSEFLEAYRNHSADSDELKEMLFKILSGGHIKNENNPDEIVSHCGQSAEILNQPDMVAIPLTEPVADLPADTNSAKKCVQHTSLGYEKARVALFGSLYLKKNDSGHYFVKDVYCEKEFTDQDFGGVPTFGPDQKPSSGNIINTEHTWPQSRFTGRFPRELQKSDLHHLFPTDSQMNSARSSLRFGYVTEITETLKCPQNKLGRQAEGDFVFEVPDSQKGNTARAIFYFAIRYQMKISPPEERALRKWNQLDPVDSEEIERNAQIEKIQGNRNPFIDFPTLIDQLGPF